MAVAPCPTATIAITAPTPMMMPSVVRKERTLLRAMERKAALTTNFMCLPSLQTQDCTSSERTLFTRTATPLSD
jgi:hypothetical protein